MTNMLQKKSIELLHLLISLATSQHSLGQIDNTIKLSHVNYVIQKINFTLKYVETNLDFRFMQLVGGLYVYHSRNKKCGTYTR
jgi:hypothetical protein